MDNNKASYMYGHVNGDPLIRSDPNALNLSSTQVAYPVDWTDRVEQSRKRSQRIWLMEKLLPHYGGDNTEGLIEAIKRLEEFLDGGTLV